MKSILTAFFLLTLSTLGYSAPRGSGTYTPGELHLYKPVQFENSGWLTDSDNSLNKNFQIIDSSMTAIINGTLSSMTSNYILNSNLPQPTTFYVSLASSTEVRTNKLTGNSGAIQASMLQGGNTSYAPNINIPIASLQGANTTFMTLDGSTQTKAGGLVLKGSFTVTSPSESRFGGTVIVENDTELGDSSGDIVTVKSASFTFVNPSTVSIPSGSAISGIGVGIESNGRIRDGNGGTIMSITPSNLRVDAGTVTFKDGTVLNFGTRAYLDINGGYLRYRFGTNYDGISLNDGDGTPFVILIPRATDIGWSVQSAANQACNTTCVHACVVGVDTITAGFLACSDTSADSCLCAGPN